MIDYTEQDASIDSLIWQFISESNFAGDFAAYLKHKPEGAAHREEAKRLARELSAGPTQDVPFRTDDARRGNP